MRCERQWYRSYQEICYRESVIIFYIILLTKIYIPAGELE